MADKEIIMIMRLLPKWGSQSSAYIDAHMNIPPMTEPYKPLSERLIDTYRARKPKKYYKLADSRMDGQRLIKFGIYPREKKHGGLGMFDRTGWADAT
jgi:hypothetical protein